MYKQKHFMFSQSSLTVSKHGLSKGDVHNWTQYYKETATRCLIWSNEYLLNPKMNMGLHVQRIACHEIWTEIQFGQ